MTREFIVLVTLLALLPGLGSARADEASPRGKLLFLRCASCHNLGPGQSVKIGPNLSGVIGRKAGSLPDFAYSSAMKQADLVWDEATLDRWLTKPTDLVPGTAMAFGGLPSADDRKAIIAYLRAAAP